MLKCITLSLLVASVIADTALSEHLCDHVSNLAGEMYIASINIVKILAIHATGYLKK